MLKEKRGEDRRRCGGEEGWPARSAPELPAGDVFPSLQQHLPALRRTRRRTERSGAPAALSAERRLWQRSWGRGEGNRRSQREPLHTQSCLGVPGALITSAVSLWDEADARGQPCPRANYYHYYFKLFFLLFFPPLLFFFFFFFFFTKLHILNYYSFSFLSFSFALLFFSTELRLFIVTLFLLLLSFFFFFPFVLFHAAPHLNYCSFLLLSFLPFSFSFFLTEDTRSFTFLPLIIQRRKGAEPGGSAQHSVYLREGTHGNLP